MTVPIDGKIFEGDFCDLLKNESMNNGFEKSSGPECFANKTIVKFESVAIFAIVTILATLLALCFKIGCLNLALLRCCPVKAGSNPKQTPRSAQDSCEDNHKKYKAKRMSCKEVLYKFLIYCLPLFPIYSQIATGPAFINEKLRTSTFTFDKCPFGFRMHAINNITVDLVTPEAQNKGVEGNSKVTCFNGKSWPIIETYTDYLVTTEKPMVLGFQREIGYDQYLIATYFISGIFIPFIYHKLTQQFGILVIFVVGSVIMGASSIVFGFLTNNVWLLFLVRFLNGIGLSLTLTTTTYFLKINFPSHGITIREVISDACYTVTPFIITMIKTTMDPFICFGSLFLITVCISTALFPRSKVSEIKKPKDQEEESGDCKTKCSSTEKTKTSVLLNRTVFMMCFLTVMLNFGVQSVFSSLNEYVEENYELDSNGKDILFSVLGISAFGSALLILPIYAYLYDNPRYAKHHLHKRMVLFGSSCGCICFFLLYSVHSLIVFYAIITFLGVGSMFGLIPAFDIMISSLPENKRKENETTIAAISTSMSCVGQTFGPFIGGAITKSINFGVNAIIIGGLLFLWILIYLTLECYSRTEDRNTNSSDGLNIENAPAFCRVKLILVMFVYGIKIAVIFYIMSLYRDSLKLSGNLFGMCGAILIASMIMFATVYERMNDRIKIDDYTCKPNDILYFY